MPEWLKGLAWKASVRFTTYRGFESLSLRWVNGHSGPLATGAGEPRQARKGATVVSQLGCRGAAAVVITYLTEGIKLN